MGYTTQFEGQFTFDKPLSADHIKYIQDFNSSRRMKRDSKKLMDMHKGAHGLDGKYGIDGEYFVMPGGNMGQDRDQSVVEYNTPPGQEKSLVKDFETVYTENQNRIKEGICQPSLWCQWTVTDDGLNIVWDGGEKFYCYGEWLTYLIEHFFRSWGYILNGEVTWQGEDISDRGQIIVDDNDVVILSKS